MRQERLLAIGVTSVVACLAVGIDVTICPTAGLFGIPCPSCGLTRALLALLRGDSRGACRLHPGVFPVVAYLLVAGALAVSGRTRVAMGRALWTAGVAVVIGLLLLWIARFCGYWGGPVAVISWTARWR